MFVLKMNSKFFFVKVILVIQKQENLLRSFLTILKQKRVELLRESV